MVFSAAKLFFAYGLGNALTFPLGVGATAVLMAERPTPAAVFAPAARAPADDLLRRADALRRAARQPRAAAARRAAPAPLRLGRRGAAARRSASAGGRASASTSSTASARTEMLHIFLSNRPGDVRYGTTGRPCPATRCDRGRRRARRCAPASSGELQDPRADRARCTGTTASRPRATFQGAWTRTGDKYVAGRRRLLRLRGPQRRHAQGRRHLRLAVRGRVGAGRAPGGARSGRRRPRGRREAGQAARVRGAASRGEASAALAEELKQHVKARLAPYKYPRWIEFVAELPKTATGKIQRFKLRAREGAS